MSYLLYLKELYDYSGYQDDDGFYVYKIMDDYLYIHDFYIKPSSRGVGVARRYYEAWVCLMRTAGLSKIRGYVRVASRNAARQVSIYHHFGGQVIGADAGTIVVEKDFGKVMTEKEFEEGMTKEEFGEIQTEEEFGEFDGEVCNNNN